ncbi:hypothetical protein GCM10009624_16250 [Gordonia sinesedis]
MGQYLPYTVDPDELVAGFGNPTVTRGTQYARDGRITLEGWSADGLTVTGLARGSGKNVYVTTARFTPLSGGGRRLRTTQCTCPVEDRCKHGVALLLTAQSARRTEPGPPALGPSGALSPTEPPRWRTVLGAVTTSAGPQRPAGDRPIGILVEMPSADGRIHRQTPCLRLVTPGKRGAWVRTGIDWKMFTQPRFGAAAAFGNDAADRRRLDRFDDSQVKAVRDIAWSIQGAVGYGPRPTLSLADLPSDSWQLLAAAADAGVTLLAHPSLGVSRVELADSARFALRISRDADGALVSPTLQVDHPEWTDWDVVLIGRPIPHGFVTADEDADIMLIGPLTAPRSADLVDQLVYGGPIPIPAADLADFAADVLPTLSAAMPVIVEDDAITPPTIAGPTPLLTVRLGDASATVSWAISYRLDDRRTAFTDESAAASFRDVDAEKSAWAAARPMMEQVASACQRWQAQAVRHTRQAQFARPGAVDLIRRLIDADLDEALAMASTDLLARTYTYSKVDTAVLCGEILPTLDRRGIEIDIIGEQLDYRRPQQDPVVDITLGEEPVGNDWLNLAITIDVDGHPVPLSDVLRQLAAGATHMLLEDGLYFPLDTPELVRLAELVAEAKAIGEVEDGRVRRNSYNATLWDELLALGVVDEQLSAWADRLRALATATPPTRAEPPATLAAELRDYQRTGLDWLRFLWHHRLGGILADDMGLGKTVQTLALIADALAEDPARRFLVVAPTSVVGNWLTEVDRFLPGAAAVAVTSTEARAGIGLDEQVGDAQIVVTSYTLLRLQFDQFDRFAWAAVIFDEAQFVKNHNAKTHQCARRLNAEIKLAITGTPMENNLMELWSLLSLTAPGLFPSPKVFGEYFRKPIENGSAPDRLSVLRRRIRPVMLRRTKDQVVADLPPKQEQVLSVDLSPRHDKIYQTRLTREREKVLGLLGDWEKNRFAIFRSLTMLRQLSLHAGLVDEAHQSVASAKIDFLAEQLPELVAEGHSALVFSQFTGFLGLIRDRLDDLGIAYTYLDGSMTARQRAAAVAEFSDGTASVFLISLKAGGFGLNLTEADYCFVCDPWWNPAAEAQAVDRAHRIGQTRPVTVYRLVSAGTIEEKVVALQDRKRALFDAVIDDGDLFGTAITAADVRELLGGE